MRTLLGLAAPFLLVELGRTIATVSGLEEVAPDPLLVALAFVALRVEPLRACAWAALAGLVVGTARGDDGAAFRFALVAAVAGNLRADFDCGNFLIRAILTLLVAGGEKSLDALATALREDVPATLLLGRALAIALASVPLALVVWPAGETLIAKRSDARRRRSS